jgi:hypothetical protein
MPAATLALALAAAAATADPVQAALDGALAVPGARAELVALRGGAPTGCRVGRAEAPAPLAASGRAAVRLSGADGAGARCEGWAWAEVRVTAPMLATTRVVREGEALEGAVALAVREVAPGRPPFTELPEGAAAARDLPAGAALHPGSVRAGPRPGEPVVAVVVAGALRVEQQARALPCRAGRACALLPSGRRVEGAWHGGRIVVEQP